MYMYVNACTSLHGTHSGQCIKSTILIQFIFAGTVFNNDEVVGLVLVRTILGLSMATASLHFTASRSTLASMLILDSFHGSTWVYALVQLGTSSHNTSMLLRMEDIFPFYCRLIEVLRYHSLLGFIIIYRLLYEMDHHQYNDNDHQILSNKMKWVYILKIVSYIVKVYGISRLNLGGIR